MITFFIKSTTCLILLYVYYHFFLRFQKILIFNRFYLVFSLIFSLIIPLIIIPVKSSFPIDIAVDKLALTAVQPIQGIELNETSPPLFTFQNIIIALYIIISAILLLRFSLNILRISRKILKSKKLKTLKTYIVLIEEKVLPYSFFTYIFVNRSDFENGKIEKELLMHEEAHCLQYHSIDTIIIELLNILFWFNPAIWLFRKSILLNHEYYADNRVLTNIDSNDYYHLLVNSVVLNNTNYLISNFKHSFIKNRLIMLTQNVPSNNAVFRKISSITLFLLLGMTLTFSQDKSLISNISDPDIEWFQPILQKHNINLNNFNYKNTFEVGLDDTINTIWLELGVSDSLASRNIPLQNAILISKGTGQTYWIITSEYARHDIDNNKLILKNGKSACYDLNFKNILPSQSFSFQESRIDINTNWMFVVHYKNVYSSLEKLFSQERK